MSETETEETNRKSGLDGEQLRNCKKRFSVFRPALTDNTLLNRVGLFPRTFTCALDQSSQLISNLRISHQV